MLSFIFDSKPNLGVSGVDVVKKYDCIMFRAE